MLFANWRGLVLLVLSGFVPILQHLFPVIGVADVYGDPESCWRRHVGREHYGIGRSTGSCVHQTAITNGFCLHKWVINSKWKWNQLFCRRFTVEIFCCTCYAFIYNIMCLSVCVCGCVYSQMCVCACVRVHACVRACMCIGVCMCIYLCICMHVCMHACTPACPHTHACLHGCLFACMHVQKHTFAWVCTYMCNRFFFIIIEATVPYFIQLTFYSVFAINTHIYAKSVNTIIFVCSALNILMEMKLRRCFYFHHVGTING